MDTSSTARKRGVTITPFSEQGRLYGHQAALFEIAFAKGYNSVNNHPLPSWRFWKHKYLLKCKSEEQAFEAGITFGKAWVE